MLRWLALAGALVLCTAEWSAAQATVFLVRHAERADAGTAGASMMATDPDLSAAGHARAEALAAALKDASITAIFVTEYKRTRQTAAPLAKARGLAATTIPAADVDSLVAKLSASIGHVLVIGHSNTAAEIVKRLGDGPAVKLGEADYDNLFVIVPGEKPTVVRLHYR